MLRRHVSNVACCGIRQPIFLFAPSVGSKRDSWVSDLLSQKKGSGWFSLGVGGFVCVQSLLPAKRFGYFVFGSNNLETIPINVDLSFTLRAI